MRFIRSLLRAAPFVTTIATLVILQSCYAAIEENGFNQRSELRTSTFIKNDIEFQKNDIATDDNINIGPPIKNETENGIEVKDAATQLITMNQNREMNLIHNRDEPVFRNRYITSETATNVVLNPETTMSNITMTALANFKGTISESFLKKFNPRWLNFPPQPPYVHYIFASIYFTFMLFGLTGNGLVIFMFIKCSNVRTPANNLILNLAVSDFLIMLEAPLFIYNALHFGPAAGEFACNLYGMLGATGGTVAIITLCAISVDRYNVIVYPLNPSRSTTNLRSRLMIIFVWIYSLPFCVLPCFRLWGVSGYIPEGFLTACSYDYLDTSPSNYWFIFIFAIAAYFVPLAIIAYCYFHILRVVLSAKKIQSSKEKNKTELRLAGIVMGIIGLWLVAWTPYTIVSLLGIFGYSDYISPLGSMIPAIMAKTAACCDPYLYAVTHPRFRVELEKMFCSARSEQNGNYQTSYYSRAGTSRRQAGMESECETVHLGPDEDHKKRPLQRAESSFCEESSVSVDVADAKY